MKNFLDSIDMKGEYNFYKGGHPHSCVKYNFINMKPQNFIKCDLKERNTNTTFELAFLDESENISLNSTTKKVLYYFDNYKEVFQNYIINYDEKTSQTHFKLEEKQTKILKEHFSYLKSNNKVPAFNLVDKEDNDNSEGGFNLQIRRSLLSILLTGAISSGIYLILFIVAKMNKKVNDSYYEQI